MVAAESSASRQRRHDRAMAMALRVRDGDTSGKRSIQRGRERAMETRAAAIIAQQWRHKWAMVRATATVGQRVFCKGSSYL
jgi:hypothetical protein